MDYSTTFFADIILGINGLLYFFKLSYLGGIECSPLNKLSGQNAVVPLFRRIIWPSYINIALLLAVDITNTTIFAFDTVLFLWTSKLIMKGCFLKLLRTQDKNLVVVASDYRQNDKYQCFYLDRSINHCWKSCWLEPTSIDGILNLYSGKLVTSGCCGPQGATGPQGAPGPRVPQADQDGIIYTRANPVQQSSITLTRDRTALLFGLPSERELIVEI